MKAAIAVGMAVLAVAGSASAYKFSPAPARFAATGPASATFMGVTTNGTASLRGVVGKRGKAKIVKATFCGTKGCGTIVATGLPWKMTATGAATATIFNVAITSKAGTCGPANLAVTVSGGVINYNGPLGQCSQATLSLTTSPTLSIVP